MGAKFVGVSEDIFNRDQAWYYVCVLRNYSGPVRVEICANAYEFQSHAKIEDTRISGWSFHTSIPTQDWYTRAPSYAKRHLDADDYELFREIRDRLLERYAKAMWNSDGGVYVEMEECLL